VLSAEATVELRGVLAHTPKGVFVLVPEAQKVQSETKVETVTWELDLSKVPELEKLAKELSGKSVLVGGTCKLAPPAMTISGIYFPPDGPQLLEMQKIVAVSKLSATDKK